MFINDMWELKTDTYCYVLNKWGINDNSKSKNYGQKVIKDTIYPVRLKSVLDHILESEVRDNIDDLQKVQERIDEIKNSFNKFLEVNNG